MKYSVLAVMHFLCGLIFAAQVEEIGVFSPAMKKEVPVSVVLPDAYGKSAAARFPVVYMLHGADGDNNYYVTDVTRALVDEHGVIAVCADGNKTSWWLDSPVDPKSRYETFVHAELVPAIDGKYRTRTGRDYRAIMGGSMGGHGACWNGIRHKELFGTVGCIFGGLELRPYAGRWGLDAVLGDVTKHPEVWDAHSVVNLASQLKNGDVALFCVVGTEDFFLAPNRKFHDILSKNGVAHEYVEIRGCDKTRSYHTDEFFDQAEPKVFRFIAERFRDADWKRTRQAYLARPRRIMIDDDADETVNFPKNKELTIGNFYGHQLGNMVGNEFDVLVYCAGSTGFCGFSRHSKAAPKWNLSSSRQRRVNDELVGKFGKDAIELVQDFARSNNYEFVLNLRINDVHDAIFPGYENPLKDGHPELLVGAKPLSERPPFAYWTAYDFARWKVRETFKRIACEWFDNYGPDGFMIDFFRMPCLFKSVAWGGQPSQEEMDGFTEMLRSIREHAERVGRRRGRPIYFAFRLPDTPEVARPAGMDVERWMREGLFDILIAGSDIGRYRRLRDTAAMCRKYGVRYYPTMDSTYLKGSPEVFDRNANETLTGHFAAGWAAGADGFYMFNMMYFPQYFSSVRRNARDLVREDKAYFVTPFEPELMSAGQPLPGRKGTLPVLCPPCPLNVSDTRERTFVIETGDDLSKIAPDDLPKVTLVLKGTMGEKGDVAVRLNGTELQRESLKDSLARYAVPPSVLKCGENVLGIRGVADIAPEERVILTGAEILRGANQPPWRRLCGGGGESIVDGAYRIANGTNGTVNLIYPIGNFAGQPVAARFALLVEPESRAKSVSLRLANGESVEVVDFVPKGVRLRYADRKCAFDTTDFHDYELRLADGQATLLADGRELLSGTVGMNADRPECQIRGNHLRILGQNEASLLLGATGDGAVGAGRWRNVRLYATPLRVTDAVLRVNFPRRASEAILNALRTARTAYDGDFTMGTVVQVPGTECTYRGFPKASGGTGVVIDNDRTEYQMVSLGDKTGLFSETHRYVVARWKVSAFLRPSQKPDGWDFSVSLNPKSLHRPGATWSAYFRNRNGQVLTPFGSFDVPAGAQELCAAVDTLTGETVLTDSKGKVIVVGRVPEGKGRVGLMWGDGSSLVSGQVVLDYMQLGFAD